MYTTVQQKSWLQILAEDGYTWQPPVTVHLPIQPVHSPDLVHVDCALNVCRRRILPGLSVTEKSEAAENRETCIVQFAFDDPPFVPDYRHGKMSLADGRYPLAHAEYFSSGHDLHYAFDYFCTRVDDQQSLLWIVGTVTNDGVKPRQAHVRAKVNVQREKDLFDYHYVPFSWDASRWLPCDRVALDGDKITLDGNVIGKVQAGDFTCAWVERETFVADGYHNPTPYDGYNIHPTMRFAELVKVIHWSGECLPGETKRFALALLVNYESITPAHLLALVGADPGSCRTQALQHFAAQTAPSMAGLEFPTRRWEEAFTELQLNILQLLIRFPDMPWLLPTQGGTSERDFVWVWEAMCMLHPLLKLGRFAPVKDALGYIFSLQDGGCPPVGRFTTTEGAIGTTGPRWMNTTGAALALATDYYRYSRDDAFLATYLPKILRAAGWITGEIRATRTLNPDGSRPVTYGLMPFGCATDGDVGYTISFTDAYIYQGLEKATLLLESIDHPRAGEFRAEVEQYRQDIATAVEQLARPDGYIERKVLTHEADEVVFTTAEYTCGVQHLVYAGALDVDCTPFARFIEHFETRAADGYFMGHMDRDIMYMGTSELCWQEIYQRRGEWKKAFTAMQTNMRYGMTQDTFQVQERFSKSNPAFTPWQPNASGNGRMLQMMLNALYFETNNTATLLGALPFAWLRWNAATALTNLHTPSGVLNLHAIMLDDHHCRLTLTGALPAHVRIPDHYHVVETNTVATEQAGVFIVPDGVNELTMVLVEEAE
ncbi:MAG: hypothetical protein ACYDBB_15190 [Armatimonadota bacterium]